jgi:hypothetical protein
MSLLINRGEETFGERGKAFTNFLRSWNDWKEIGKFHGIRIRIIKGKGKYSALDPQTVTKMKQDMEESDHPDFKVLYIGNGHLPHKAKPDKFLKAIRY